MVSNMFKSLRQSFYHGVNDDERAIHIFNHELQSSNAQDQRSVQGSPIVLRSQPADISWRQHTKEADAAQHILQDPAHLSGRDIAVQPNVTDRSTVINLAKMTSDAYYNEPSVPGWLNLTDGFNHSHSFGWKKDGLRGHVFANADNSTVVIAFKGTTIGKK